MGLGISLKDFLNNRVGIVIASVIDQDNLVILSQKVEIRFDGFKVFVKASLFVISSMIKDKCNII